MTYTIEVRGRTYRYATLELALKAASDVFGATGVVVGVSRGD